MATEKWNRLNRRKPTVDEVVTLAKDYYAIDDEHSAGGSFHIVLDDGNTADTHVAWCEGYAHGAGDKAGYDLGAALRRLSKSERDEVYKRYGEYYQ